MKNYSTLIFVGNGFDLAVGFPTSYSHFYNSDYFKSLIKSGNSIAQHIEKKKLQTGNWSDLELELFNIVKENEYDNSFGTHFNEIKQGLYQFIQYALRKPDESFQHLRMQRLLKQLYSEDNAIKAISFNYSAVFEYMWGRAIDSSDVETQHVHGSLGLGNSASPNIVLGIDETMQVPDELDFLYKANDDNRDNYSLTELIQEAKRIIIFGCSMGESDRWYFEQLFQNCKGKLIEIHAYKEDAMLTSKRRIKDFAKKSMSDFTSETRLVVFDNSDIDQLINEREIYYKTKMPDYLSSLKDSAS